MLAGAAPVLVHEMPRQSDASGRHLQSAPQGPLVARDEGVAFGYDGR
jgi:hypothetical protein